MRFDICRGLAFRDVTVFIKFNDWNYTVNHKKRDILFLTITLANLNRFL